MSERMDADKLTFEKMHPALWLLKMGGGKRSSLAKAGRSSTHL